MRKRPFSEVSVFFYEINYPEDFPIAFTRHIQRYQSGGSLHFHNGLEIGICYEGSGLFFVENNIVPFGAGDISVIFQDQPHIAQSPDENPSHWSFLTVDTERLFCDMEGYQSITDLLYAKHSIPNILTKKEHGDISEIVRMIFNELEKQLPDYRQAVKSLLWAFLLMIARMSGTEDKGIPGKKTDILRISPSINFICAHYREKVSINKLARLCNLSSTHFRRVFKETMGRTPSEYLFEVRMHMAKSMLKSTNATISEVALSVGYETLSSFNRHFQKSSQTTPRDYRKLFRNSDSNESR